MSEQPGLSVLLSSTMGDSSIRGIINGDASRCFLTWMSHRSAGYFVQSWDQSVTAEVSDQCS